MMENLFTQGPSAKCLCRGQGGKPNTYKAASLAGYQ